MKRITGLGFLRGFHEIIYVKKKNQWAQCIAHSRIISMKSINDWENADVIM